MWNVVTTWKQVISCYLLNVESDNYIDMSNSLLSFNVECGNIEIPCYLLDIECGNNKGMSNSLLSFKHVM